MDAALPLPPLPVAAATKRVDPPILGFVIGAAIPALVASAAWWLDVPWIALVAVVGIPIGALFAAIVAPRMVGPDWVGATLLAALAAPLVPGALIALGFLAGSVATAFGSGADAILGGVYFALIALVVAELGRRPDHAARRVRRRAAGPASLRHVRAPGPGPRRRAGRGDRRGRPGHDRRGDRPARPLRHRARRSPGTDRRARRRYAGGMCRSIRQLRRGDEAGPATTGEAEAAALQYVRKISGFRAPSAKNAEAFQRRRRGDRRHAPSACSRRSGPPIAEGPDPFADPVTRRAIIAAREARSPRSAGRAVRPSPGA